YGKLSIGQRAVPAPDAGVDPFPQVRADARIGALDVGQRPPDRLAHRQPGPLAVVGERPRSPTEPGTGGELGQQPLPFAGRLGRATGITGELGLVDLIV